MHAFNPSHQEVEAGGLQEFEDSLVYRVSSKTVKSQDYTEKPKRNKKKKKKREKTKLADSFGHGTV